MATIEIKDGIICLRAYILDEATGEKVRKRKSTGLKNTKANMLEVKKKYLPAFEKMIKDGEIKISIKVKTIKELGEEYIESKRSEQHREYSITGYENSLIRDIYPMFGHRASDSITVTELNNWQRKMLLKVGEKRLQNIKIPFNGVMTLAHKSRLISENPFLRADKIGVKKNKEQATQKAQVLKDMASKGASADDLNKKIKENNHQAPKDPFSENELKTLFSEAKGFLKNYIQIAFFTAMRPSELIALEWGSVNLEKKFILCAGAITGKETINERELNKSAKSVRVIYLADQAVEAFKEQYKLTGKKSKYVFLTQYGMPYASVQSIREKSFKKLLKDSKVRNRRLYDLRHSYASINLSQNRLPILFVSEQMGHSDASVTLKEYSAYIANSSDDSLALVQKAFINF